ncbi:MAG: efflux RND transporter periplasmic adaptor subunit [Clostridiales bacterium]|nr:efflux RND transporter periplasmic adaptor subunit [Clostridiales bacterium]
MKKSSIFGVIVAVAFCAIVAVRVFAPEAEEEEEVLPVVETETLQKGDIVLYRDLVGTVEPADVVYIYPQESGDITGVFVKTGDIVEAGQLLCTIDTKLVESSRLSMESALTSLESARNTYNRQRALYEAGDIASATFESVEASYKSAQIQYDQAKLAYDYQLEYSNVTATIGGKVEQCGIEMHDNVSTDTLVCVISGEGSKTLTFSVPEKIVGNLSVGDTVTATKSGSDYQGVISEISSMIDSNTGLFRVKALIDEGDALATGSTVSLSVVSDHVANADTLSVDSIYYSGGDSYVYLYEDGIVRQVAVEVGVYDSERAQILSGVSAGDEVITTWTSELYEGSEVRKQGEVADTQVTE